MARARALPAPEGLPEAYAEDLRDLFGVWGTKLARNVMRSRYYQGHNILQDLGISIPPQLTGVETVVGWPAKAVDSLAARSRFEGFSAPEGVRARLDAICERNGLVWLWPQLVTSELIHSCAFVTVTRGEDGAEVRLHSAVTAAALWDYSRRRVRCGVTLAEVDRDGLPQAYNLFEPDCVVRIWRDGHGRWSFSVMPHPMGRPLMEAFVYRPNLDRPFGVSKISREIMTLTDSAVRTALRSEISAEFFTSPQRVMLGAPDDMFSDSPTIGSQPGDGEDDDIVSGDLDAEAEDGDDAAPAGVTHWEAYTGSILAVSRDENGEIPSYFQLPQGSMQPHIDYMRSLGARMASAANVPVSALGIIHDQPASAEAMHAAEQDLVIDCEALNEGAKRSLRNVAMMALAIEGNKPLSALTDEERSIRARFHSPQRPSEAAETDAMVKQASVNEELPKTRLYWEKLGYPPEEVDEIMAATERHATQEMIAALASPGQGQAGG